MKPQTATPTKQVPPFQIVSDTQPQRDAYTPPRKEDLPFFRAGRGKVEASWWNVAPSGNWSDDLETGRKHAQALKPFLFINAGPVMLGWIVNDMAKAGHGRRSARDRRMQKYVDGIAFGFMQEIGRMQQSAIGAIAVARMALDDPHGKTATQLRDLIDNGDVLNTTNRQTLAHDPNALFIAQ